MPFEGNWLYAARAEEFIAIAKNGEDIAALLTERHVEKLNDLPSESEILSWKNSLRVMANLLETAGMRDQLVILEYCPPSRDIIPSRVDVIVCGADSEKKLNAVFIELKQWSGINMKHAFVPGYLWVHLGGQWVKKRHPRSQIEEYRRHMRGILETCGFAPDFLLCSAYAYLHNAMNLSKEQTSILFGGYHQHEEDSRLYTQKFVGSLIKRLQERVGAGQGEEAFLAFQEVQRRAIANIEKLPLRRPRNIFAVSRNWYDEYRRRFRRTQIFAFLILVLFPLIILIGAYFWLMSIE